MILFCVLTHRSVAVVWAENKGAPSVETLLQTLNETLEENRKLRTSMKSLQESLEKITVENADLKGQLKKMSASVLDREKTQSEELKLREAELAKAKETVSNLVKESKTLGTSSEELQARMKELRRENERLEELLGSTILESEKEDYLRLIENARDASSKAVSRLSRANREIEELRQETSSLAYQMAVLLFQKQDYEAAARYFSLALERNANLSYAHHNLGVLYDYYLDDDERAIRHYKQYLNLKPVEERALEIRKRILDLTLLRDVTPKTPLHSDFVEFHKDSDTSR
jgi:tetratricopeptide (TPR) repeat protein